MTMRCEVTSPLPWTGGKHASARRILAAFPPAAAYDTYVEPFGGAAHVLAQKHPGGHIEVYNDLNSNVVNFWMVARDQPDLLQARVDSLPYSRHLFEVYRRSLHTNEALDDVERAARWFYLLRSTFGGGPDLGHGWGYAVTARSNVKAWSLRTVTALLSAVSQRFRLVQIERQDFATLIAAYQTPRTLFYVDPPYIGCEAYYAVDGVPLFSTAQHQQLADLLNATPALVTLSYYEHPWLDDLYPTSRWRRLRWAQTKAVEHTRGTRQLGQEVLLMNYPETAGTLWTDLEADAGLLPAKG
jgi:DNA adenine methylase